MTHSPGDHEPTPTPAPDHTPAAEKKTYKGGVVRAGVVDVARVLEAEARDAANLHMTESKENREAGWLKRTVTRIWKHNLGETFYRRREYERVRKELFKDAGATKSAREEAMSAISARFASEYKKDMLREEEQRDIKTVVGNENINKLVSKYADGSITEAAFEVEKNKILASLKELKEDYASKDKMYTDNLLQIAKEIRDKYAHSKKLDDLDVNVELTLGRAKEALNSEAQMGTFDRAWDKFKNTKVGRIIGNDAFVSLAGAAVYSAGKFFGVKALRSKLGQFITFGATAIGLGAVTGVNESVRLERERAQHMRERASGKEFKEKDMKRREIMERNRYETVGAKEVISKLTNARDALKKPDVTPGQIHSALEQLVAIEARIRLGDRDHIDLINYSDPKKVEKERTDLLVLRAEMKVALRKVLPEFDHDIERLSTNEITHLLKNEGGIEEKNKIFKKMKHAQVAKKVVASMLIGSAVSIAGQELVHTFVGHEDSSINGAWKHWRHHNDNENLTKGATSLETLRRYLTGDQPRMPMGTPSDYMYPGGSLRFPEGVTMNLNPDGTYNLMKGGEILQKSFEWKVDANGDLVQSTKDALAANGIFTDFSHFQGATHMSAAEYVKAHESELTKIHREMWYDNDTKNFDHNELRGWWGGEHGTGIDADGNYVFNMSHMTSGGSWHGAEDLDAKDAIKNHGLTMLFSVSRDTQYNVFKVPIDENGNAVIIKGSELWKQLFKEENGHAVFLGKYAEVAEQNGIAKDGGEIQRILATYSPKNGGKDVFDAGGPLALIKFNLPEKTEMDLFPPVYTAARRPLEKDEKPKDGHHGHEEHHPHEESHTEEAHEEETHAAVDAAPTEEAIIPAVVPPPEEEVLEDEEEIPEEAVPEEEAAPALSDSEKMEKLLRSMPKLVSKKYDELTTGQRVFFWGTPGVIATIKEIIPPVGKTPASAVFINEATGEEFSSVIRSSLVYSIQEIEAEEARRAGRTPKKEVEVKEAVLDKDTEDLNEEGIPRIRSSSRVLDFLTKEGAGVVRGEKDITKIAVGDRIFIRRLNKDKVNQIVRVTAIDGNNVTFKRPGISKTVVGDITKNNFYRMTEIEKAINTVPVEEATTEADVVTPTMPGIITIPETDEDVSEVIPVNEEFPVVATFDNKTRQFIENNNDVLDPVSFMSLKNEQEIFIADGGYNKEAIVVDKKPGSVTLNMEGVMKTFKKGEFNDTFEVYLMNDINKLENATAKVWEGSEFLWIGKEAALSQLGIQEDQISNTTTTRAGEVYSVGFDFKKSPDDVDVIHFMVDFKAEGKSVVVLKQETSVPVKFNSSKFEKQVTKKLGGEDTVLKLGNKKGEILVFY